MPSTRPSFLPGHYYHIYNRGAHQLSIFREPDNYLFAIRKIKLYCRQFAITPIAYCLMPNHYHFLVRQESERPARLLPQRVFNSYTKAYNKRYNHSGTLFEGHYKAIHIQKDAHLVHLCRYIHANPVKDGLIAEPADWPYSNYLDWIGERPGTLIDRQFIEEYFAIPSEYIAFVLDYLKTRRLPEEIRKHLAHL